MARSVKEIRELFDEAAEFYSEQHKRMLEDAKFSNPADPQQWPDSVAKQRESEGRPCLTFDRTNAFIAQVVNDGRQNKPSINVIPGDSSASVKTAKAIEGIVRHVEYVSRAGIAYDTSLDQIARVGLGWIIVRPEIVNPEMNEQEPRICRVVDPRSVMIDPDSIEPDGSDALFGFIESSMSKRAFEKKYPKAKTTGWDSQISGWFGQESLRICEFQEVETKKRNKILIDIDGQRISVGEDEYWDIVQKTNVRPQIVGTYFEEERVVRWYKMNGVEFLEEPTVFPSKYLGIVPVIGDEIWIEGERYLSGMVRRMRSGQKAYNYERTSYIEQVALQPKAPYVGPLEAFEGLEDKWRKANSSNAAYLPYNHIDESGNPLPAPSRQAPPAIAAAFVQGAQLAATDIEFGVGMFRASLGAPTAEHSGKAILAKQREGDTANFHYVDNQARSVEQCGRVIVDMLPRLMDTRREVRILGEDGQSGIVEIDPSGRGPDSINLQSGKYDVRIKSGPSYTTLRQQTAESIGQLVQANPALMPIIGPEFVKMMDWPGAERISKLLMAVAPREVKDALAAEDQGKAEIPPQVVAQMQAMKSQMDQAMQMVEQLTGALHEAKDQIEEAEGKLRIEEEKLRIDHYKAETDRLKVVGQAVPPQEVAILAAKLVMQSLHSPSEQEVPPIDGTPPHEFFESPETEIAEHQNFAQSPGLDVGETFSGENL